MKITIIGAGNVATHLAGNLSHQKDIDILQIFSKTKNSAKILAKKINCAWTNDISKIIESDLYIIATNDDSIQKIAQTEQLKNKFIVHTSGSVEMKVLSKNTVNFGVFYPLQTFQKEQKVEFSEIPMCIEASNEQNFNILRNLAKKISKKVYKINSEQRKNIHIAAVFVNNFINHLFHIANEIISRKDISIEILKPLIEQTFKNIQTNNPYDIQTGPAKRNDKNILENHIETLKTIDVNFAGVYRKISDSIIKSYN